MGAGKAKAKRMDMRDLDRALLGLHSDIDALRLSLDDDPEDLRFLFVSNLLLQCEIAVITLRLVEPLLRRPGRAVDLGLIPGNTKGNTVVALRAVAEQARANFASNWIDEMDRFTGQVASCLGIRPISARYKFGYAEIFEALRITGPKMRAREFTVLHHARLSQQNNGVHKTRSCSFKIDQRLYRFRQGKVVKCTGWDDLLPLMRATLETLAKVLRCRAVANAGDLRMCSAPTGEERSLHGLQRWERAHVMQDNRYAGEAADEPGQTQHGPDREAL